MLSTVALGAIAPAHAQEPDSAAPPIVSNAGVETETDRVFVEGGRIVIYAIPLDESARALAQCLERQCPPEEDINLSLTYANNLFVEGEYRDARAILHRAIDRNKGYHAELPVPVAQLYQSNALVAQHLGEANEFTNSVRDARDILRENLDDGDMRVLQAEIAFGVARLELGYQDSAAAIFADARDRARTAGHARLAALADLRGLSLETSIGVTEENRPQLRRVREKLSPYLQAEPLGEDVVRVANLLVQRINIALGEADANPEALAAAIRADPYEKPLLLTGEPVDIRKAFVQEQYGPDWVFGATTRFKGTIFGFEDKWADIGYRILPDGSVADVEVIRSEGDPHWIPFVIESIQSRQYTPLARGEDGLAVEGYSVERYSFTARYKKSSKVTGTRIRQRSERPRIERLDISYEISPQSAPAG